MNIQFRTKNIEYPSKKSMFSRGSCGRGKYSACVEYLRQIHLNFKKQSQYAGLPCSGWLRPDEWPETRNTKPEIRNELNGCYLKKQSQFAARQYWRMLFCDRYL